MQMSGSVTEERNHVEEWAAALRLMQAGALPSLPSKTGARSAKLTFHINSPKAGPGKVVNTPSLSNKFFFQQQNYVI